MSYQGPPSWQVPPPGGWPQQPQPPQAPVQWQPPAPQGPPPVPNGYIGCRHCGLVAPPRLMRQGGTGPDGCVTIVLFCFGIVPGVLYVLFGGSSGVEYAYCQRCNALHGPWGGSNAGWIVAGAFFGSIAVLWALFRLSQ